MIKDEDGNLRRMTVLQKPISLDQLDIEYEDNAYNITDNVNVTNVTEIKYITKSDEELRSAENRSIRKEPVCFDKNVTFKKQLNVTNKERNRIEDNNDPDKDLSYIKNDTIIPENENLCKENEKQYKLNTEMNKILRDFEMSLKPEVSKDAKVELKKNNNIILKDSITLGTLQSNVQDTMQNKVNTKKKDSSKPGIPEVEMKSNMAIVKTPILLDSLQCDEREESKVGRKNKMTILKKPIPLDSLQCDIKEDEFPFTVKLISSSNKSMRNKEEICKEFRQWQQNALTIFEYSHVYPFIHTSSKYKCIVCYKLFLEAHLLKIHIDNDHTMTDLKAKLSVQVKEKNLKVDITSLQCKICSTTLSTLDELKIHLKNHGKNINLEYKDNIIPFKLNEKQFDCQICADTYPKLRLLVKHMNSNHFNNFSCEYCGSQFVSLRLLKSHLQSHEIGNFPCSKCNKVFKSAVYRSNHIRVTHLKHLLRICPYCPERFNSNYNRTKHIRIAHKPNTELFKCETCGKAFDLKYHLRLHIRSVHLQERNFECNICHLRFFNNYTLSRHMKTHTGDYQFKCQVCGKGYSTRFRLREHCKTHDMVCYSCGVDCRDHDGLAAHVNEVHGGV